MLNVEPPKHESLYLLYYLSTFCWLEMFFSLQFLSMRLAAVNPRIDFNIDAVLAAEVSISELIVLFTTSVK